MTEAMIASLTVSELLTADAAIGNQLDRFLAEANAFAATWTASRSRRHSLLSQRSQIRKELEVRHATL